ncbi:MAG: DUF4388 domain-containing protein [Polyangiales bacterium]
MSDAPQRPVATGTLAKTPFTHLVLYLYQRRSSGTLLVGAGADEVRVLFHRGRAVAARTLQPSAALDEALLPITRREAGEFEFHEADLVGSGAGVVTGMFDPFAFVVAAIRGYAPPVIVLDLLAKYAAFPLALDPALDLGRLGLTRAELHFMAPLERGPVTLDVLLAQPGFTQDAAQRLVYTLLITRALGPASPQSQPAPSSQPERPREPPARSASSSQTLGSLRPSRSMFDRLRPSGDAWRAIASRAAEMADRGRSSPRPTPPSGSVGTSMRPSERGPSQASRRLVEPPAATSPSAPRVQSQSLRPESGAVPRSRPTSTANLQRPVSRPLTEPLPGSSSSSQRAFESRPLTPTSFRGDSSPLGVGAGRSSTSSPIPRVTPRPSLPDIDTLDADGKFRRVELLCQRNAFDEAIPIIRMLLESDRKSAKYLGMLSHVLLGRTGASDTTIGKEIVDSVNQALRMDPDQVHALYTKARCYKRLGKEREALHYFRRTVAVDPSHLDAAREVRLLVSRLGDKRKR